MKTFYIDAGVRQGNSLSPTLFSSHLNLAIPIKSINKGVKFGDEICSVLLYTDYIVPLAESEEDLQYILDSMHSWCSKWQLHLNPA